MPNANNSSAENAFSRVRPRMSMQVDASSGWAFRKILSVIFPADPAQIFTSGPNTGKEREPRIAARLVHQPNVSSRRFVSTSTRIVFTPSIFYGRCCHADFSCGCARYK
jgi:hypothetical protein